jgi:hypothetical protein
MEMVWIDDEMNYMPTPIYIFFVENRLSAHSVTISDKLLEKEKVHDLILKSLLGLYAKSFIVVYFIIKKL